MAPTWWYWPLFNTVARLFGIGMTGVGALGAIQTFLSWNEMAPDQHPIIACVSVGALLIGVAMLRAGPYRPDLAFEGWTRAELAKASRSWWTGTPR